MFIVRQLMPSCSLNFLFQFLNKFPKKQTLKLICSSPRVLRNFWIIFELGISWNSMQYAKMKLAVIICLWEIIKNSSAKNHEVIEERFSKKSTHEF